MNRELVVGVKLTVREDLNLDLKCKSEVVEEMLEFAGREVTVKKINLYSFDIEEDDGAWFWNKEMFKEFIEEVKV